MKLKPASDSLHKVILARYVSCTDRTKADTDCWLYFASKPYFGTESGEKHGGLNLLTLVIFPALTIVLMFGFVCCRCIKARFETEECFDEEPDAINKKNLRAKID